MSKKTARRPKIAAHVATYNEARPLESLGLGCHPRQVRQFREDAKRLGFTAIDFNGKGECLITDRKQRAEYAEMRGMHDNDGCYGDG